MSEPELQEVEAQLEEIGTHFASTSAAAAAGNSGMALSAEHVAQAQVLDLMGESGI